MGDVIEVEFERLDKQPLGELARDAASAAELVEASATRVIDAARKALRDLEWYERQLRLTQERSRQLELALGEERRRSFPFTDEAVEAALRRVSADVPVHAGDVAAVLVPDPTQSMRVRCGHALSRLAAAGLAEKIEVEEHGRPANVWRAAVADEGGES